MSTSRSSRSLTTGVFKVQFRVQALQCVPHMMLTAVPGALIHWLFLTPDRALKLGVLAQNLVQIISRERIKLLETHDSHIVTFVSFLFLQKIIVDFKIGRASCRERV